MEIPAGQACGAIVLNNSTTDNGCTTKETTTFNATADGIEDGKYRVDVTCTDGRACNALFNVYFTHR